MECPNCTFNCMPGVTRCVRCGARLDLAGVSVDPPRARGVAVATARRVTFPVAARYGQFVSWVMQRVTGVHLGVPWGAVGASVIPGGGLFLLGRRKLAIGMFLVWVSFLLAALRFLPNPVTMFMLVGAAISVHSATITLLFTEQLADAKIRQRMCGGVLIYAFVMFTLYLPARYVASGLFRLVPIMEPMGPLRVGDVVVFTGRWTSPQRYHRGDIVFYRAPPGRGSRGHTTYVFPGGDNIDRIIGEPGETVRINGGEISVDGAVVDKSMLPIAWGGAVEQVIAAGPTQYVILPSAIHARGAFGVNNGILGEISGVSEQAIHGRLLGRIAPFSRMNFNWSAP